MHGGYAGIVALMGIESACIPLPSEIIMPFAGYLVYLGHFNLFGRRRRGRGLQSGLGGGVLDWRQGRAAAGGAVRQMGADEPPRPGPHDGVLSTSTGRSRCWWRGCCRWCARLSRFRRDCEDAAGRFTFTHLWGSWPWCFALAYAGMKLGEAWHTDPRFMNVSSLSSGGGDGAAGGDCVVCVVAPEARQRQRGVAMV
jgi:hypothetical protein